MRASVRPPRLRVSEHRARRSARPSVKGGECSRSERPVSRGPFRRQGVTMKSAKVSALGAFVLVLILPESARPCTTFVLKDKAGRVFFGRNFDFPGGPGHIHVNLRGARKSSLATPGEKPLTWTARYGSISFNQNGREVRGARRGIQCQPDTAATVADVLASDRDVRISDNSVAPLHFLVADVGGGVAVVEYLAGKMVYRRGQELPLMACANGAYEDSLAYFTGLDRAATDRISNRDGRISSDDRFSRAADMVQAHGDYRLRAHRPPQ